MEKMVTSATNNCQHLLNVYHLLPSGYYSNMSKEKLQKIRLKNFQYLRDSQEIGKGKISNLARAIMKSESLTRFYLNPDKKGGRWMGEDFAREIEDTLDLDRYWMDVDHNQTKEKKAKYKLSGFTYDSKTRHIKKKHILWSFFCKDVSSINSITELTSMLINKDISVPEASYIIEVDNNNYKKIALGTQLLIDPEGTPKDKDAVIISFGDNQPTLVRWISALGETQAEPLETGYPNIVNLKNKNYKILGVAIWIQHKGTRQL